MPNIYRYALDITGTNPDNLVQGEEHILPNRRIRAVAPTYGAFYTESLVIVDKSTNLPLERGINYEVAELVEVPTSLYGKEICGIILITDSTVSPNILVSYQVLGAEYSYSMSAIVQMIEALELDNRPVDYKNVYGKPISYTSAPHLHDAGDVYGFEYLVNSIERLTQAIKYGDSASHDEIYRYVDNAITSASGTGSVSEAEVQAVVNSTMDDYNALFVALAGAQVKNNVSIIANADKTFELSGQIIPPEEIAYSFTMVNKAVSDLRAIVLAIKNDVDILKVSVSH